MRRIAILTLLPLLLACHRTDEHAGHTAASETTATQPPINNPALDPKREAGPLAEFGNGARGYLTVPNVGRASARRPALIVIQEWWGVNDWVRAQADRYSEQGYVALAVDLYRGKVTSSMDEAHELSRGLPEDRAIADLKAAVDYLSQRDDVDPQRIGVIGWCLGGGYALALATNDPRVKATVINYGRLVTDPDAIAKISGPVLGNFGGADRGIPPEDVRKFGAELTKYGKLGDIKIYEGAGHAFMNPDNKQGYDAAAAQDAQGRIDRFFDRNLRANMPNS
ncbi:MAG TPA: dienelactone hydrolase family protein [Thermoanaerobaculia bacterium]